MLTISEILSKFFQNKSLINANLIGFNNHESPLSKRDEAEVLNFMYVDLPSMNIIDAKKSIVSVLGCSGAGYVM